MSENKGRDRSQEDYLFNLSIRDNIVMGRSYLTEAQIAEACALSRVDRFAPSFEDGYETIVGENGMRLSAGQKKRIAMARALADNPHVLIFDEATSVLDEENEREILRSIRTMARERIVILITHKRDNVTGAAQIVHMADGGLKTYDGYEEFVRKCVKKC